MQRKANEVCVELYLPSESPLGSEVNDLFSLFREVSLYEDILTRVCTLVSATPATCFHVVVSKVNIIVIL